MVCLKKIPLAGTWSHRDKQCSAFAKELSIMARLRSPRVVQVIGVVTTDNAYLGLVMEYLERGSPAPWTTSRAPSRPRCSGSGRAMSRWV